MKDVDKSYLMKRRHQIAKESRQIFRQITKKDLPYSVFFSNSNPVRNLIKKYEVTYYLDYYNTDEGYSFHIDQNTFEVYMIDYGMTAEHLDETVSKQIVNIFQGDRRKQWIANHLEVNVKEVGQLRGLERSDNKLDYYELEEVLKGFKISKGNLNIVVRKNHTKNRYKLNLWV